MATAQGFERGSVRRGPEFGHLLGRVAMVGGLILLIVFFADFGWGLYQEQQLNHRFEAQVGGVAPAPAPAAAPEGSPATVAVDPRPLGGVDFAIRVPRIGYFAAVAEGTDTHVLAGGPGHYPETAWPGQTGNVGVAAHNVYWIKFNDLQAGDTVQLQTRWGTYSYQVTGKQIVSPDNRQVLAPTPDDHLTLTTCWPLWAGAFATQRLVISTVQVDPQPRPETIKS